MKGRPWQQWTARRPEARGKRGLDGTRTLECQQNEVLLHFNQVRGLLPSRVLTSLAKMDCWEIVRRNATDERGCHKEGPESRKGNGLP
jgi:hypothetical protein